MARRQSYESGCGSSSARSSRRAGDRNLKIWIKGETLRIGNSKGYMSDGFHASLRNLLDAVEAAGAVRSGHFDTIEATYTLA